MKVNVDQEELLKLSRYSYLSEHNKIRWLFSFNDLYLRDYILYNKLFNLELITSMLIMFILYFHHGMEK